MKSFKTRETHFSVEETVKMRDTATERMKTQNEVTAITIRC